MRYAERRSVGAVHNNNKRTDPTEGTPMNYKAMTLSAADRTALRNGARNLVTAPKATARPTADKGWVYYTR